MSKTISASYDEARKVIQQVVEAATRNPRSGEYIGCQHHRMKQAVAKCEDWLAMNPELPPSTITINSAEPLTATNKST